MKAGLKNETETTEMLKFQTHFLSNTLIMSEQKDCIDSIYNFFAEQQH